MLPKHFPITVQESKIQAIMNYANVRLETVTQKFTEYFCTFMLDLKFTTEVDFI